MDRELRQDIERYLVQRAERDKTLWVHPAKGVEKMDLPVVDAAASAPAAPRTQSQTATSGGETAAPAPAAARSAAPAGRGAPEPTVSAAEMGTLVDPFPDFTDLDGFRTAISGCVKCPLGKTRQNLVFGVGDPNADLVIVGEAPGADEDRLGDPFVGRAGQLLDKILAAVDLKRGDGVYIANILKCRPPNNRDPNAEEVEQCEPHLLKQLQLLNPKLIVALGRIAAQTLMRTNESLSRMRGRVHDYHGVPLLVTYHPAALLRNPNWKRPTWEDVQQMKKLLDEKRGI